MTKALTSALKTQKKQTQQVNLPITGTLGIPIDGMQRVEVPNRNSFVYVKLRDNQSEVIQAFNNQVAAAYGLPVIVEYRNNRYYVTGVDTIRYQSNWSSFAPFLPRHGNTHSFNPEAGGGGDIVWVTTKQFMPLLIFPSGTFGAPNVSLAAYTLRNNDGSWKYIGPTGTQSLLPYRPTNNQAVMALVYLDTVSGNPYLMVGSGSYFAGNITGTAEVVPYIPSISNPNHIPLMAVRLVSGTSTIKWDNLYDVRQFLHPIATGTTSGGSISVWDEGILLGSPSVLNFVGNGVDVSISGSVARIHITGSSAGGTTNLTGTSIGIPNRAVVTNSSGFLTTDSRIGWGLNGSNGFLEFGVNVAGKETNAGKIGYALFDTMLDIVGANFAGSGTRWVRIYDALYSDLLQGGNIQNPTLTNTYAYLNATGTLVSAYPNAPEKTYITGADYLLMMDSTNNFASSRALVKYLADSYVSVEGWSRCLETWTRTGNHTFTVSGNLTAKYRKGAYVRYADLGGTDYGVIYSSSFAAGTTTVNLIVNSDYTMSSPVFDTFISYIQNPEGWPDLFNFTLSGLTASGSMLPFLTATTYARWKARAKTVLVEVQFTVSLSGTASTQINVDTPVDPVDSSSYPLACAVVDGTAAGHVGLGAANGGTDKLLARKVDATNWSLGSGRIIQLNGEYPY